MFVRNANLSNGTGLELIITSLEGTALEGQWGESTGHFLLCVMNHGRCCTFKSNTTYHRFKEKLSLPEEDAKLLKDWIDNNYV